ncbi:MAG: DUF6191 domain-containing protein [Propioniciclava sp.]
MSELFEAFAPGLRHWREQRELQKVLVHRTDQGAPGPVPVDLDSGTIVVELGYPDGGDHRPTTTEPAGLD